MWDQANASMGSFSSKAPALVRSAMNLATTADGMSLNSNLMQCAVPMRYFTQVSEGPAGVGGILCFRLCVVVRPFVATGTRTLFAAYLGHARGVSSRYAPLHCLSAFADVSLPKRLYGCILGFCVRSQVVIYLLGPILAAVVPFVLVTILFVLGKLHGYARGTADQVLAKRCVRGSHRFWERRACARQP
jgi:hypothetical protein